MAYVPFPITPGQSGGGGGGGGAVDSVNGQTGTVTLTAADVGADASGVAAGLVDDLSGVTNTATARSNLGLGALATKSAVGSGDITDGSIVATDLSAAVRARVIQIAVSSPTGDALATGDGRAVAAIPAELNGFTVTAVQAAVSTVSSSGAVTVWTTIPPPSGHSVRNRTPNPNSRSTGRSTRTGCCPHCKRCPRGHQRCPRTQSYGHPCCRSAACIAFGAQVRPRTRRTSG